MNTQNSAISLEEERWEEGSHQRIKADMDEMLNKLRMGTSAEIADIVDSAIYDPVDFCEKMFKIVAKYRDDKSIGESTRGFVMGMLEMLASQREDKRSYDPVSDSGYMDLDDDIDDEDF